MTKFVHFAGRGKMLKNKLSVASILITVLVCILPLISGCNSIPAGTPPAGNIVNIELAKDNLSINTAINHFATGLTAYLMSQAKQEVKIELLARDESSFYLKKLTDEIKIFVPLKIVSNSGNYTLKSEFSRREDDTKKFSWHLFLIDNTDNNILWQEKVGVISEL